MQIFLSSSAKRCRYGANYEALRRALWAQKSLVTVTSDYHWQGSKVQKYPDKELLACSSTLQHFNPKSNKWRRFSTAVTIVREEEDDDHEVKKDVSASEGDKSLIQVARSFCYGLKYTKKNFQESETVRKEALRILQQLTGVGHRQSVDTSIALAERLRSACDVDPIDAELLNRILRNWANCPDVRTSTKELKPIEALIATPSVDLYAIILQKIGSNSNSLSLEEYIRQTCSRYQELCADDEAMRQQLDEITENIIVQFKARKPDTLVDAMEKAKEDVGRGFKLHEDTFLSILFGALTSPPEKRPQVKEFLTWAGEQYDANSLAIQVESIFLFGWASQVKTESGSEPPEWLLQCIGWIGEKVTADVRATTEDYERAIKLWAMAGQGLRAKALLMNMLQSENSNVVPTLGCYNTVLACLAESDDSKKGSIAVELLDQMNSDKNPELIPNYATYQLTLDRLRSSKEQSAPVEAIRIVREMTDASKSEALSMRAPTSILYSNVANGLRFQQDDWRPMDEFLKWLEEQKEEGNQQARVDIYHYDQLLILKSRSEEPDIAEMGISIFDKGMTNLTSLEQIWIACAHLFLCVVLFVGSSCVT